MKTTITLFLILITSLASNAQNTLQVTSTQEDNELQLKWSTSKEVNSTYFLVETSNDGIHYQAAGRVKASGYAMHKTEYTYVTQANALYYRITLVGMSGEQISLATLYTEESASSLALNK